MRLMLTLFDGVFDVVPSLLFRAATAASILSLTVGRCAATLFVFDAVFDALLTLFDSVDTGDKICFVSSLLHISLKFSSSSPVSLPLTISSSIFDFFLLGVA